MIRYRERLYPWIYNMTFNHDDAADLTQETFVKAFLPFLSSRKSSFFTRITGLQSYPNFEAGKSASFLVSIRRLMMGVFPKS